MHYLEHTYTKQLFIVYLKFKFNYASCILSGNSTSISVLWFQGIKARGVGVGPLNSWVGGQAEDAQGALAREEVRGRSLI